jgi:Family of unknown function (DUF5994)
MGSRCRVILVVTDYFRARSSQAGVVLGLTMTPVVIHAGTGTSIMTSVRTTTPNQVDRPSSTPRGDSIRLSLKPSSSAKGALDGAWWPRSTDPS